MEPIAYYHAPWGRLLKTITGLSTLLLAGLIVFGLVISPSVEPGRQALWLAAMVGVPAAIWLGAALFTVTGYTLCDGAILVHRPGWRSVISLDDLQLAVADAHAMDRSLKTWGNGGLFAFCGHFRNKRLGPYRAYATDPKRSVVLRFPNEKAIVITPENPALVAELLSYFAVEARDRQPERVSA